MEVSSLVAARPVLVFITLAIVVLIPPSLLIPFWYQRTKSIERNVDLNTNNLHLGIQSEIENIPKFLHPISLCAVNLARILNSSVNGRELSYQDFETKVAPVLYQAFLTIPLVSTTSYIGLNGSYYSYYTEGNQTFTEYFNSSSSGSVSKQHWYILKSYPWSTIVNSSWFQAALNSTNGYASLLDSGNGARDSLFLNTASMNGHGIIALWFPVKALTDLFAGVDLYGGSLYLATVDGKVLLEGIPNTQMEVANNSISFRVTKLNGKNQTAYAVRNVSCKPSNGNPRYCSSNFGGTDYKVYCSRLEIMGVQSVYALAFPHKRSETLVHKTSKLCFSLFVAMIVILVLFVFGFVKLMVRSAGREMHLCSDLIKQMEATQQAERKSMNKSLAFASASHDIRTPLAGIVGLIKESYAQVPLGSILKKNLQLMESCAEDLLGLLNSILDTSKIEAGKIQLEEEEFNLARLLEEITDLFYPMGMGKGVDVVLDPCDGSIMKYSLVKGDRGKLKQILCNLLSNAVKFTSEGHVSLRAWVQKPSLETAILASNRSCLNKYSSCFSQKNKEASNDIEAIGAVRQNPNSMEYVFEVDDTGKGIPKEKQKSVFENFVQVKETCSEAGGTGLGLGIVQSLVRLMGGEIGIIDKQIGEKGTRFRFNVFLVNNSKAETEAGSDSSHDATQPSSSLTIRTSSPRVTLRTSSPKLGILTSSPKPEQSQVVLLIQNEERRKVSQKFMEKQGINVMVVDHWESLPSLLEKTKSKQSSPAHNSLVKSEWSSRTEISGASSKDVPLSAMDGTEQKLSLNKRRGFPLVFVLLVIDATAGPFSELCRVVAKFRKGLHNICCKVVWLDKPTSSCGIESGGLEEGGIEAGDDDVIIKLPFHGSRLYQVLKLLPEFEGSIYDENDSSKASAKDFQNRARLGKSPREDSSPSTSSNERSSKKWLPMTPRKSPPHAVNQLRQSEIQEEHCEPSGSIEQSLSGKRILVAEDDKTLRYIAMSMLGKLGAIVEVSENGEEALNRVTDGLKVRQTHESSDILPYDYIFMDCQMPVMNGYEASRQIRIVEKQYGVHIPIFALTAHTSDVTGEIVQAGMDFQLSKPLSKEELMKAIQYFHGKNLECV